LSQKNMITVKESTLLKKSNIDFVLTYFVDLMTRPVHEDLYITR